jgi:hypothetical protein
MTVTALSLTELKPGLKFPTDVLKTWLPDVETAMFFAQLYKLDAGEVSHLLYTLFGTSDVVAALTAQGGEHSTELQDYLLELGYETLINEGHIEFTADKAHGEILPEVWKQAEVTIAKAIQEVADKVASVVAHMPGKEGEMLFSTLMVMNSKRPILGDHRAKIHHAPKAPNLVVLDVSGSMTQETVSTILEDVVAMAYMADAHLAVVSDTATHWQPGEYGIEAVLSVAEFSGTHYETLSALFDQNWGVVVTIADYDSSAAAAVAIKQCTGSIQLLLDISLVSRPTYLAEVLSPLAVETRPLLIAADHARLCW